MRIELVRGKEMESATAVMRRMRGKKKKFINKVMLEKNVKYFVQIMLFLPLCFGLP